MIDENPGLLAIRRPEEVQPTLVGVAQMAPEDVLREAARAFEAAFLAEMLKHSGLSQSPEGFGGGIGEEQFSGFLREAQAKEMAEAGGIGLAEHIFRSLQERARSNAAV